MPDPQLRTASVRLDPRARVGLGTVQFGLTYGIANRTGQTPAQDVADILRTITAAGITLLDTASGYGTSESVLGHTLPPDSSLALVTKTPSCADVRSDAEARARITGGLNQSCTQLQRARLYGLLVHSADDLSGPYADAIYAALCEAKSQARVEKIGMSAYAPEQVTRACQRFALDLVQIPLNVLDQRFAAYLPEWKKQGLEIHVRSAYLQGLLLMPLETVPDYFTPIRPTLEAWHALVRQTQLSPQAAALAYVLSFPSVDRVIVGVDTPAQTHQLLQCLDAVQHADLGGIDWSRFAVHDTFYISPNLWPRFAPANPS